MIVACKLQDSSFIHSGGSDTFREGTRFNFGRRGNKGRTLLKWLLLQAQRRRLIFQEQPGLETDSAELKASPQEHRGCYFPLQAHYTLVPKGHIFQKGPPDRHLPAWKTPGWIRQACWSLLQSSLSARWVGQAPKAESPLQKKICKAEKALEKHASKKSIKVSPLICTRRRPPFLRVE